MPSTGQGGWKAGAAKVDITPDEPIWLAGYGGRTKVSEEIIQHIYVKALALQDETGRTSVIVTSDLVGLSPSMIEKIVERAQQEYRLTRERLILNYSHNHSAPVTADVLHIYYDLEARQPLLERERGRSQLSYGTADHLDVLVDQLARVPIDRGFLLGV